MLAVGYREGYATSDGDQWTGCRRDVGCDNVWWCPGGVCTSDTPASRRVFARRRPTRVMEPPVRTASSLTLQDPLAAAGAVVLDCRPHVLPGVMDDSDGDSVYVWSRGGCRSTSRT